MAHIGLSVQRGTILWGLDLDFWLYLAMQTPLCQHCWMLLSLCACMCARVSSDCGDHYAYSAQARWANSSLISARHEPSCYRIQVFSSSRREGGHMANTRLWCQLLLLKGQRLAENFNVNWPPRLTKHGHGKSLGRNLSPRAQAKRKNTPFCQSWEKNHWHLDAWWCLYEKILTSVWSFTLMVFTDLLSFLPLMAQLLLNDSWHNWLKYWLQFVLCF